VITTTPLFERDGNSFVATDYARGPWDPRSCHGGPVSALLVRASEAVDTTDAGDARWQLARVTVELTRPVPVLTPLQLDVSVERPGRNVSLIAGVLTANGTEVARSRALRIRDEVVSLPASYLPEPAFGPPGEGYLTETKWADGEIAFHRDSVEMRFLDGSFAESGPVKLWCRLLHPVVAGETPSGAQRAAAAADFGNGVSSEMDPQQMLFINPDLSVHLSRPPVGEWIGMQTRSHYGTNGAGLAESALYDANGRCGRSVQSLYIAPR